MWMDAYVHEVLIRQQIAQADERAALEHLLRRARRPRPGFGVLIARLVRLVVAPRSRRPVAGMAR